MALDFTLRSTTCTPLWDFGWFDTSSFEVRGPAAEREDCHDLLRAFFRASIAQRSFYESPDPWGGAIGRHGPFPMAMIEASWFASLPVAELERRVHAALDNADFSERPSREQRAIVEAWLNAAQSRDDEAFELQAPRIPSAQADWNLAWILFREFARINRDRTELTIAVIGYD